ncbi:TPA: glycerophosphodiester phosphodiesterase family protein, partial [Streptococcus pyogenes]
LHIGLSSVITQKLYLPEFIVGELSKITSTKYLLYGSLILVFYLNLRLVYFLPLIAINHRTVAQAWRESWQKTKKKHVLLWMKLFAINGLTIVVLSLAISMILIFVDMFNPKGNNIIVQLGALTFTWELIFFTTIFFKLCSAMILKEAIEPQKQYDEPRRSNKAYVVIFIVVTVGFAYQSLERLTFFDTSHSKTVIAHRGLVSAGVENSLEALEGAKKAGSDYVELDLILTKDNHFVVSHDNRLKRLAGVNKTIRNLTLKEVEHLTSHQGHFSGRFVSFDTFYQKAKKLNMPLLIELKPIGTEPGNYVDLFLETYHRLGISKDNKVM